MEPTKYIYQVQDESNPTDTRFLHVLQGADPGTPMALANYSQSSGATPFDGAAFGAFAVYFPQSATNSFEGTIITVPVGVHILLVTGLTPNMGYSVYPWLPLGGNINYRKLRTAVRMADNAGVVMANF